MRFLLLVVLQILNIISISGGGLGSISVVASVRGKKFDITAETVEELSQLVEGLVPGMDSAMQSVLFRGKVV
jgi:hypothetical protein